MNIAFYIARRYFFGKKSHHIINIISGISVAGITIGTAALIIVLSVFNGFEGVVSSLFNSFNPDLKITAVSGKILIADSLPLKEIRALNGVAYLTETLEENALLRYRDKQAIVTIKGVGEQFSKITDLPSMITEGNYLIEQGTENYAVVGQGIAYNLGLYLNDFDNPLDVYVPRRGANFSGIDPSEAFNYLPVHPSGIFSIQQDFDQKYVIVPLRFARDMLESPGQATAIEIGLGKDVDMPGVQEKISNLCGSAYVVKNRFEQEAVLYKIMRSEKLAVFVILAFILLIAIFNVIGSISMLILDKKKDISVLKSLGADERLVRRIFFTEGMIITLSGLIFGLLLGGLICWAQKTFELITIDAGNTFVIQAYPVRMMIQDFIYVSAAVLVIGLFASWYPVKYISAKYLSQKLA